MKKTKLFINILACVAMLFAGGLMTEATAQATATGSSMDVGKANGQHIGWAAGFFNPAQECAVGNAQSCPRTSELDMSGPIIAAAGGTGPIVEVQLDVDYDHTWVDDIQIYLVSPEGTEVHVRENQCGSQNGVEARYNDNSGVSNGSFCGSSPKTGGNFSEQETFQFGNDGIGLNDFVGEDPSGVWELKWGDDAGQDGGTLQGWSLQIMFTPPVNCDVVCPPDTLFYDLDPFECDVVVNYYSQPVGDECGVLTICDLGDPSVDKQTSVALGNNAVRCNPAFGQSATRMARVYSVPAGNCGPSVVTGIEAGIHPIGALGGGSDPFNGTARIYSIPFNPIPGSFAPGALTLLAEVDVVVTAASATQTSAFGNPVDFYTFDFPAPVMFNPGEHYVVELEADNNNGFYHDGNFGGQSRPTYINCPSFSGIFPNYDNVGGFAVNVAAINANSVMTTTEARLFLEEGQESGSRFGPGCTFNKLVLLADDPDDPNAPKIRVDSCEFEVCVTEFPDPGSVSCNDNIQVSLEPNCQATIRPDDILEGSYGCVDDFMVEVLDGPNPNFANVLPTSPMVTSNEIGSTLAVRVTDTETNTSCWGTISVEDKTPPTIECPPDASIGCDSLAWLLAFEPNDMPSTNSFISTDVPVTLPASPTVETSNLVVPPNFKRVNTSDVNVFINMTHTDLDDLRPISIESPSGTVVTLITAQCPTQADLNTIFDDEGDTWDCALRNDGIRLTPPNGSLSDFDGEDPVGQWTLSIDNTTFGNDGGELLSWGIELTTVSQFQRPFVEDACCLDNVYYEDEENVDDCGTGTVSRTWYAVDCYKNESSCVQTFTVIPNDPPGIIFPQDLEFDCPQTADNLKPSDIAALPPNVVDNNGLVARNQARPRVTNQDYCGNIAFNYEDQLFDVCLPYGFKIRRTWTAVDWCDPQFETSQTQIIKVIDDERPVITCPQDKTISTTHTDCFTFLSPDPIQSTDNCDPTPTVTSVTYLDESGTVILPSPQVAPGNYIIKYEVSDDCGNTSACQQRVTVVDNVPPVAICDVNTQISLTAVNGWADLCATVVNDGSYDNCGPITIEIRAPNLPFPQNVWSPCVRFFCTNIGDHIVELRVTDAAGNYNICWANVSVEDKLPPSIICPSDVTVDCTVDFLDPDNTGGEAQGLSACGGVEVDYVDLGITSCVGTFTRRWTASKEIDTHSGPVTLTATCDQQITVVDNTPASVEFPEDITLDCPAVGTDPASLSQFNFTDQFGVFHFFDEPALDYDCEQLGVSSDDEIFDICLPAGYKIRRTWHVVDWCDPNFDITHVQVIKVQDIGNPEIFVNGSQNYNVFAQITNNNPNCEMYVDLVATATDDCSAVSISNDSPYSDSGNGFDASGYYPKGTHNFTFTAIDDCGNITERDVTVTVVDAKDPSPVCLTIAVDIKSTEEVSVTPDMLNGGSTDNCTDVSNLTYQLEVTDADDSAPVGANPQDELIFTCDDRGVQFVRLWAFDASNNGDYCVTTVYVQDNNGYCGSTSSGFIAATTQTADGEDIDDVNIYVNNAMVVPGMFGSQTFNFQAGNVMVEAEKDINLLNGVSTLDIILIRKHILGIDPFDSPYKWVAADIDHSESISTIDIVHLRKAILNLTDEFKDNTSWRFIDEAYTFTTQNPLGENFPEYVQGQLNPGATLEADFVGVKIGDVSGNATPNSLVGTQDRNTNGTMLMNVDAAELTTGEEYTVEFKANDIAQIAGYQFTLEFDASAVEFVGLEPGALNKLTEENFGLNRVSEGVITTSWDDLSGAQLNDEEVVFTITFRALDQVNLSEVLYISSRYTRAEAYTTGSDLKDVALEFVTETGASDEFALYQNRPNPFANSATIGFDLPEAGSAMMTIYDLSGKVVKQIEGDYAKGYNEVVIKSSELHGAGVLYYELVSGEYKATKKMIVIE